MVEERKATLKRVKRLLDKASTSDLLWAEASLRNRLGRQETGAPKVNNPSGSSLAGPCSVCGGQRPPHPEAEPWHLRQNSKGQHLAKSGRCASCVWSLRSQQCRSLWPHWQSFRDGTWPPTKGV